MHHQRRKSGHGSANTSYSDVRKAVTVTDLSSRHKSTRPAMTRRTTPQVKLGKNPRDREREMEDEYWLSDERESFPQFWYAPLLSPRFRHLLAFFAGLQLPRPVQHPAVSLRQPWCHGCFCFTANPNLSDRHDHHDAQCKVQGPEVVLGPCAGGRGAPPAVWVFGRCVLVGSEWELA